MKFSEKYCEKEYIESDDHRSIVVAQDKRGRGKWIGRNLDKKRVVKYRVDDGIIKSKAECKCDYAVCVEDNDVYLVELKGADYNHALQQVLSTIDNLILRPQIDVRVVNGRIVLSRGRNPNVRYTDEVKLIKKLKALGGSLKSGENVIEENI